MKINLFREQQGKATLRTLPLTGFFDLIGKKEADKNISRVQEELLYLSPGSQATAIGKIPTACFSTLYSKKDGQIVFKAYQGLILLEVDQLAGKEEIGAVKKAAGSMPQTLAAFTGLSGRSVKIIIPFIRPDGSLPQNEQDALLFHLHAYRLAIKHYQVQLPFPITIREPTLRSGCHQTHDPGYYYNPGAQPIRLQQPLYSPEASIYPVNIRQESNLLSPTLPGYTRYRTLSTWFETSLADTVQKFGEYPGEETLKGFLVHLAGNCFRSGIPEEDTVRWTLNSLDLHPYELEVRQTIRNQYSRLTGFDSRAAIPATQLLIVLTNDFMKRRYRFRYNTQTMQVEYIQTGSFTNRFQPVDERVMNSIALNAQAEGLQLWDRDIRRYLYSDRVPVYSPLAGYLSGLPEWDHTDQIRQLARRIPCNNMHWPDLFYRWFLNMVAHWLGRDKEYANSTAPVLIGSQGCGKSTFCRRLLPPELRSLYTDSIDFSRKRDAELSLHRFALINMDEFDQISTSYQGFMKHILQKPASQTKLAYQKGFSGLSRHASFIATSNHPDLLTDLSGNRRYICIGITGTINNQQPIHYEQLYAQAIYLIQHNEQYHFTAEEEAIIERMNEDFRQVPAAEQLFVRYFRIPGEKETYKELLAIEVLEILKKRSGIQLSDCKIIHFGRILQKLKVPARRITRGTVYSVIEIEG